jgi:hypothetical protein
MAAIEPASDPPTGVEDSTRIFARPPGVPALVRSSGEAVRARSVNKDIR